MNEEQRVLLWASWLLLYYQVDCVPRLLIFVIKIIIIIINESHHHPPHFIIIFICFIHRDEHVVNDKETNCRWFFVSCSVLRILHKKKLFFLFVCFVFVDAVRGSLLDICVFRLFNWFFASKLWMRFHLLNKCKYTWNLAIRKLCSLHFYIKNNRTKIPKAIRNSHRQKSGYIENFQLKKKKKKTDRREGIKGEKKIFVKAITTKRRKIILCEYSNRDLSVPVYFCINASFFCV